MDEGMKTLVITLVCLLLSSCSYRVEFTQVGPESFLLTSNYAKADAEAYYSDNGTLKRVRINMLETNAGSPISASLLKLLSMGMLPLSSYLGRPEADEVNTIFEDD